MIRGVDDVCSALACRRSRTRLWLQIEKGDEAKDFNRRLKKLTDACMLDREHPHSVC